MVLSLLLAAVFLILNRAAYQGYFQDDELDNLSWAPLLPAAEYLKIALAPRFQPNNFRPVGHFYFHAAEGLFDLEFPGYVATIHALHLFNVWLLWLLARRLGAPSLAASAACFFFALHMALFDNFWKPMYVFDVLCATFCLLSLLWYVRGRWVLSFAAFWLAYKSKELAVMLPAVLACYEVCFGPGLRKLRWKPLAPFLVMSLSLGIQGILLNPNRDNDYTFRFTPTAVGHTSVYYAGRLFLVPYLGFAAPLAALTRRNPRTWFGLAMMLLFFLPLLFLPGRLFSAYCYVPFIGFAIALTGIVEAGQPVWPALFLLLWAPVDLAELRAQRRVTLARDADIREWVTTAARFAATSPAVEAVVFSGAPAGFQRWGAEGTLKYLFHRHDLNVHSMTDPEATELLHRERTARLTWDPARRKLEIEWAGRRFP